MAHSPKSYNDYTYSKAHAQELIAEIRKWLGHQWKGNLFTNVPKKDDAWHFNVYGPNDAISIDVAFNHRKGKALGYRARIHPFITFFTPRIYHPTPLKALQAAVKVMEEWLAPVNAKAIEVRNILHKAEKRLIKH